VTAFEVLQPHEQLEVTARSVVELDHPPSLEPARAAAEGVGQDIAHITVGALRTAWIPARYVTGNFDPRADPQPGQAASAQSHAWAQLFVEVQIRRLG
jgi:Transglutaminase-like superfamily